MASWFIEFKSVGSVGKRNLCVPAVLDGRNGGAILITLLSLPQFEYLCSCAVAKQSVYAQNYVIPIKISLGE